MPGTASTIEAPTKPATAAPDIASQVDDDLSEAVQVPESPATDQPRDDAGRFKPLSEKEREAREASTLDLLLKGKKPSEIQEALSAAPTTNGEAKAKPAAPAAETKKDEAPAADETAAVQHRIALVKAENALRRDGTWSDEEIKALSSEKLLEKGSKALKRQADVDRMFNDRTADRRQAPSGDSSTADGQRRDTRAATAPAERRTGTNPADMSEGAPETAQAVDDGLDNLLDELDPETAKPLRDAVTSERKLREEAERKAQEAQAQIEKARDLAIAQRVANVRQKVVKDFPWIKSQEAFDSIVEIMDDLDHRGEHLGSEQDVEKLMRQAAWSKFGEAKSQETRRARNASARAQLDGQPDTALLPAEKPTRAPTQDEMEAESLRALNETGNDRDAALRLMKQRLALAS